MNVYEQKNIRNIAVMGHAGSGKTSLIEALLYQAGSINRRGTIEERNTQSDFHELEHERSCSIFSTVLTAEWNNLKLNIIDTPGYDDYVGELIAASAVADTGLIVLNAQSGVEVGTENAWNYSGQNNIPVFFVVNKLDVDQAHFDEAVSAVRDVFTKRAVVIEYPLHAGAGFNSIIDILNMSMYQYPAGGGNPDKKDIPESEKSKVDAYRNELIESIAETDENLMTNYFENGTLTDEEIKTGFHKAFSTRQLFPVLTSCSKHNIGTDRILDFIKDIVPSPEEMQGKETTDGNFVKANPNDKTSLFIFKMTSEAHLGDMTFFKVQSGKVSAGIDVINEQKSSTERFNQIFAIKGKNRIEVPTLLAGDIGATVKLKGTQINNTLHEKGYNVCFNQITYPNSRVRTAVVPKTKGEEEKVGMGLHNLHLEDPTLVIEHSQELRQIIIHAQGELHLAATKWRLEHRYKVESEFIEPKVPYRETIQKQVRGMYRHKKQSGGAGQFAEVHMIIEPWYEDAPYASDITVRGKDMTKLDWGGNLEFVNCIVGGVIDQRFLPAIMKGVMDKMHVGPLTGSYVRDIRIYVHDGKMHPVDSNEAAFKTAGMMVFKENFVKADPKVLEPIYDVTIRVPEDFVGDVMSDLPSRRGLILGIDADGRYQTIKARMPMAELDKYATALRSMTQARASHTQSFAEYQAVPPNVQMKLIDDYKKKSEEE
jgi:elongation factor G